MSTLWITEFRTPARSISGSRLPVPKEQNVVHQTVTYSTATQSAAFDAATVCVRLWSDAAFHVRFGADPTATTGVEPMAANQEYFREVVPGQKLSALEQA